jgi:hypothetical protein
VQWGARDASVKSGKCRAHRRFASTEFAYAQSIIERVTVTRRRILCWPDGDRTSTGSQRLA